ncbi:hypothetical protein BVAD3_35690 [Bacillus velezensis]|nr:hypothetical protein BVAD3_35690 [Bacillus velezensis]
MERSRNNEDRRTVWMTLSESGKMAAMQMIENRQMLIDELFEALTEEEKNTFFSLVEKVMK